LLHSRDFAEHGCKVTCPNWLGRSPTFKQHHLLISFPASVKPLCCPRGVSRPIGPQKAFNRDRLAKVPFQARQHDLVAVPLNQARLDDTASE
jgi:hypothetical protein